MTTVTAQQHGSTAREEFGGNQLETVAETASHAVAAQARAQVEARYIMAMKRPRDIDQARMRLLKECSRPAFAESAWYRKPIGKGVEGLSIRFAEAAARCLTNIYPEAPTVYEDAHKRILRVSVTDLESNVTWSKDLTIAKTVERRAPKEGAEILGKRMNAQGDLVYILAATDDELVNKENALVSKALRTLIMRLVPGDLIDECTDRILATRRAKDAADPDAARKRILDSFAALGVQPADLRGYLGHEVEKCTPAQVEELRGYYTAIRDGETTWKSVMDARRESGGGSPSEAPKKGAAALKAALAKKAAPSAAPTPDTPAAPEQAAP